MHPIDWALLIGTLTLAAFAAGVALGEHWGRRHVQHPDELDTDTTEIWAVPARPADTPPDDLGVSETTAQLPAAGIDAAGFHAALRQRIASQHRSGRHAAAGGDPW